MRGPKSIFYYNKETFLFFTPAYETLYCKSFIIFGFSTRIVFDEKITKKVRNKVAVESGSHKKPQLKITFSGFCPFKKKKKTHQIFNIFLEKYTIRKFAHKYVL